MSTRKTTFLAGLLGLRRRPRYRSVDPAEPAHPQLESPRQHAIERHAFGVEGHPDDAASPAFDRADDLLGHIFCFQEGAEEASIKGEGRASKERGVELAGFDQQTLYFFVAGFSQLVKQSLVDRRHGGFRGRVVRQRGRGEMSQNGGDGDDVAPCFGGCEVRQQRRQRVEVGEGVDREGFCRLGRGDDVGWRRRNQW